MNSSKSERETRRNKDVVERSFEKETDGEQHESNKAAAEDRRSVMGAPVDPNSPTSKGSFPPGLPAEDAVDPGRATPQSGSVDNRSGEKGGSNK